MAEKIETEKSSSWNVWWKSVGTNLDIFSFSTYRNNRGNGYEANVFDTASCTYGALFLAFGWVEAYPLTRISGETMVNVAPVSRIRRMLCERSGPESVAFTRMT